MRKLQGLEPGKVFEFFEQLSAIPRGSGNTRAVSDFLVDFAKERGLEYYQDELENVVIIKPASPGYENADAVMIQGHMDMVCQQAPDCTKDMEKEGLDLAATDEYVYAEGTTLGADDGIAVAMAMALLDAEDVQHPRLEAVITVDEEVGLTGAAGLDMSVLRGTRLINIDSEIEGIFTVGCAGGARVDCCLPVHRAPFEGRVMRVDIKGLKGGHSGIEIDKGRANPNILMGRVLRELGKKQQLRLISAFGGDKDNAIPTASCAFIAIEDEEKARTVCAELDAAFRFEYSGCDDNISLSIEPAESELTPMDEVSGSKVITLLCCSPCGVQAMSAHIPGLVQTSLNAGILSTAEEVLSLRFSVRSSIESQKYALIDKLRCLTEQLGGTVSVGGEYPGWAYREDSPLRELMVEVFREQYGKAPQIEAIHAGLECGLFIGKRPELDCISFGPQIDEIHTFREKLYIRSTQRTWELLKETLRRMK